MKVLYILNEFPRISHTFILDQINFLTSEKVNHQIVALTDTGEAPVHKTSRHVYDHIVFKRNGLLSNVFIGLRLLLKHPVSFVKAFRLINNEGIGIKDVPGQLFTLFHTLENNPDIIHAHFGYSGNTCVITKLLTQIPLITSFYGRDASQIANTPVLYNKLFSVGDVFLALSRSMVEDLNRLGCSHKKIKLMYLGVDTNLYKKGGVEESKDKFIITVGSLVEKKGHKYLISAFNDVLKQAPDSKLHIIGSGPEEEMLKKQVKELNLSDNVKFTSSASRSRVVKYLSNSDVGALTSVIASDGDIEGTPMVLAEMMSVGLPVVSTKHSGIPEVVKNKETGFLCEEKDEKCISECLIKILKNKKLKDKMGKNARKFVLQNFNARDWKKNLLSSYEDAASLNLNAELVARKEF